MDKITRMLQNIQNRLEKLEKGLFFKKLTIPPNNTGYLVPKVVTTDPSSPEDNEVWINSTTSQFKWNDGGTIKAVPLT